jgi:hypothetical protein
MLLANRLWEKVDPNKAATLDDWGTAYREALEALAAEFEALWRGLDASAQKTLKAIVMGDGSPYAQSVLGRLQLSKDMVRKALPRLIATADVESTEAGYVVVDPLFARWVARLDSGNGAEGA